jgi:hypothetical protein
MFKLNSCNAGVLAKAVQRTVSLCNHPEMPAGEERVPPVVIGCSLLDAELIADEEEMRWLSGSADRDAIDGRGFADPGGCGGAAIVVTAGRATWCDDRHHRGADFPGAPDPNLLS